MSRTQRLNGAWTRGDSPGGIIAVILEQGPLAPGWTSGAVRTAQPTDTPALTEAWMLLGWSIRCTASYYWLGPGVGWGRLGDLWGGLLVDGFLQDTGRQTAGKLPAVGGGAVFPQDLSTFARIFDGSEVALPFRTDTSQPQPSPFGLTYMFPAPIEVRSGAQIQMALILTPGLTANNVGLRLETADFTVLYES